MTYRLFLIIGRQAYQGEHILNYVMLMEPVTLGQVEVWAKMNSFTFCHQRNAEVMVDVLDTFERFNDLREAEKRIADLARRRVHHVNVFGVMSSREIESA